MDSERQWIEAIALGNKLLERAEKSVKAYVKNPPRPKRGRSGARTHILCRLAWDEFDGADTAKPTIGKARLPGFIANETLAKLLVEQENRKGTGTFTGEMELFSLTTFLRIAKVLSETKCAVAKREKVIEASRSILGDTRRAVAKELKKNVDRVRYSLILEALEAQPKLLTSLRSRQCAEKALQALKNQLLRSNLRDVTGLDTVTLASAAMLVHRLSDILEDRSQTDMLLKEACRVILGSRRHGVGRPRKLASDKEDLRVVYTHSWQDLDIISQLPFWLLPEEMPAIAEFLECLSEEYQEGSGHTTGWGTPATPQYPAPVPWLTAHYARTLRSSLRLLRYGFTEHVLRKAERSGQGSVERFEHDRIGRYNETWKDIPETEEDSRKLIWDKMLDPSDEKDPPPKCRSALLWGPPGTTKTTMVRGIAHTLRRSKMNSRKKEVEDPWPLFTITPADLINEHGYDGLVPELKRLLELVRALSEVVVFFDEAENLVFSRNEKRESRQDRMVTAAMLPLLNNIEEEDIVFIMATNSADRIDPAVSRRGRFGLRVAVGPPNDDGRRNVLRGENGKHISKGVLEELVRRSKGMTVQEVDQLRKQALEIRKNTRLTKNVASNMPLLQKTERWELNARPDRRKKTILETFNNLRLSCHDGESP